MQTPIAGNNPPSSGIDHPIFHSLRVLWGSWRGKTILLLFAQARCPLAGALRLLDTRISLTLRDTAAQT
jgi:hypothetical protein